ncbi:polysaccharide biosynthesis/export family protein [Kaistella sp.]|uniref:polysaccharide biosynthesis/export family protein n=1 Tax=Kaistella sp. TaxID=2782235 RepID=UPI003C327330
MQNIEEIATQEAMRNTKSTLQAGDQLVILITAKDMDVVRPFNQNYSSGEISQTSVPSGNFPNQGQSTISGPTYIIDSNNQIDFPVLGQLSTAGKTLVAFKDELRDKLTHYIKNPSVNMRVSNYKVTILGEVARPGQYIIPDGQTTLLNVIGLAGDLTMYGKRDDILIVRNENGQIIKDRVNILKADFIQSPYYNLKQGDVIYVAPNKTKEKTSRLDPNTPIYIAVAGIVVTILALVFKK